MRIPTASDGRVAFPYTMCSGGCCSPTIWNIVSGGSTEVISSLLAGVCAGVSSCKGDTESGSRVLLTFILKHGTLDLWIVPAYAAGPRVSSPGSFLFTNTRKLELRGGTLSSTRGQGQSRYHRALLSLASQDEACVRTEQLLNLHWEMDGIYHVPLLGWLGVRLRTTGLHHPDAARVLLSTAAQHRASGRGAGTCPGWRWKRRAARHCQGWDGVVWGEAAITELPWLLPSSRNALRGRVRPSLSIITTAVMSGDDCLSQAPGVQHRCRHCQRMLIEQPQQM